METNEVLPEFQTHPEPVSVSAIEESIRRHVKYSLASPLVISEFRYFSTNHHYR